VYADGTTADATLEDQVIWLHGFDVLVDGIVEQGFYNATRIVIDISGTDTVVYEVLPQPPICSSTGTYQFICENGVWKWDNVVDCAGTVVEAS
jgi:hypothetical protein